jgi:hypothetical protein
MEYLMIRAHVLDKLCKNLSKRRRQNRPLGLWETSNKTKLKSEYWNALAVRNLPHLINPTYNPSWLHPCSLFQGFDILMEAFAMFFIHMTLVWRCSCVSVKCTFTLYTPGGDNVQSNFPQVLCTSYCHSDRWSLQSIPYWRSNSVFQFLTL